MTELLLSFTRFIFRMLGRDVITVVNNGDNCAVSIFCRNEKQYNYMMLAIDAAMKQEVAKRAPAKPPIEEKPTIH